IYECDFEENTFCDWQIETTDKSWTIAFDPTAYAYVSVESTGGPVYFSTFDFRSLSKAVVVDDDVKIFNSICPSSHVGKFEDSSICVYQNDATVDFT
ncbi:unnamed protein product, partial [Rotaria sordida]